MSGYTIREARPGDCRGVLDLWREAQTIPSPTDSVEELQRLVREDTGLFLVAEENARLVGSIVGGWDGWRGNMYRLAVPPAHRRRGIARALVTEVEARLRARGARRVSALVARDEEHAVAFWEAVGYPRNWRAARHVKTLE